MSDVIKKMGKSPSFYKYFPVLIVLCIGILISTLLFNVVRGWEQDHIQREFIRASKDRIEALNREIEFDMDTIEGLQALYIASNKVERYEFHLAAKTLSAKKRGLMAVEWIPQVTNSRREEYEEAAKRDGFVNFKITEKDADGQLVRAARREEYFPIYFLEPYEGNEFVLGFDLASNPERRKALYLARDSGNATITSRIILVHEAVKHYGHLVFLPIYKKKTPTASLEERRQNIEGFLLAVFRTGDIIEAALSRLKPTGIDINIFDDSAQENKRFLYFHPARSGDGLTGPISYKKVKQLKGLHYISTVPVANRKWLLVFTPTPYLINSLKTLQPLIVLTGGVLTTVILSSYVWFVLIVSIRTKESAEKSLQGKLELEKEVSYRKKVQEEREVILHSLQERIKELNCLYIISNFMVQHGLALDHLLQKTVNILPSSWQYPDITCARIIFEKKIFKTDNYKGTEWKQSANIISSGKRVGEVEVCYIEKKPEIYEGPFLKEERKLIDNIAIQLGNVIERKQTETKLESTRSHVNNIIKSSLDMIITVNKDRKIVEFNEAAVKAFGYKKEEVMGSTIEILYASQEETIKPVEDLKQKGFFHGEVLNRKKNGDIFPAFVSASFIKDEEGNILGTMGISRDISRQKEAEEALNKSEVKYRELVENARSIIIRWDKNANMTFFNEYAQEFFGFTEEEILGRQVVGTIVSEKDASGKDLSKMLKDIVSRPDDFEYNENENIKKNGERVWVAWKNKMVKNPETSVDEMLSIGIDMTEHKKAEEALKESELKFRSVTESATDAIISADSNGNIISWNHGATRIFGYSEEEVLHKSLTMLMPERYRKAHEEGLRRVASKGVSKIMGKTLEFEGLRKEGTEFPLDLSLSTWKTNEGTFFSSIIRDTTERKVLETHLSQAQKLESIGSLAAGIAHEINTPTQFVSDNIHFLKESFEDVDRLLKKYSDLLDANNNGNVTDDLIRDIESVIEETDIDFLQKEIPKAIQASQRGSNRVSTIVKAMKEFSHPGTKEKTPTNINHAIENTITISKNEWKYVADVVTDFDENLPLVPCLPGDFNQVILNLITNATHAISKVIGDIPESKGTITISTRKDGDFAVVTISDTGAGIPDSIKDKIFYPFFTTKEVGKGTGQGLAISHSVIVDKHKGTLFFESEEGKGATFIIRLSLKEKNK